MKQKGATLNTIELTNLNPELINDIKLFRLVLTPLEMFVLKNFLSELRPLNVREVYTHAILSLFKMTFRIDNELIASEEVNFAEDIINDGYGRTILNEESVKKVNEDFRDYLKNEKEKVLTERGVINPGKPTTEIVNECIRFFKLYRIKTPSYEKIQGIFNIFERLGIIYKRSKQGKITLHGLNPKFYYMFKDKIPKIIKL